MNKLVPARAIVALATLAVASMVPDAARAGPTTMFTFANQRIGTTTFVRNVGQPTNDLTNNNNEAASGQKITLGDLSIELTAGGGTNADGNLLAVQRFNLADPGIGVRGGATGRLDSGEWIGFSSSDAIQLTGISFSQTTATSSFELFVDGASRGTFTGSTNALDVFPVDLVGRAFEIRANSGDGRLVQFSAVATPEPSTLSMAAFGATIAIGWYLRRPRRDGRGRTES